MLSSDTMLQRNSSIPRRGSFAVALSLLLEMFPTIPQAVIEAVLREHNGNLQSCSEFLLASQSEDRDAQKGPELATPNDDQVWQDEELARAMQASLDAEAGRSVGLPWLTAPRDGNEGDSPSSAWPSGSGDMVKDLKDTAASIGQTLSDGLTSLTETFSGWLATPFWEDDSPAHQRARSPRATDREVGQSPLTNGDTPLHRRLQPTRSSTMYSPEAGPSTDDTHDKKDN